jgi:hypothetical protein
VTIVWVIPAFGQYEVMHHEAIQSFRNCNELGFWEIDTLAGQGFEQTSNYAMNLLSQNR